MIGPRTPRALDRVMSLFGVRFAVWLAVAGTVLAGVLVNPYRVTEFMDDHILRERDDIARFTYLRFHELPAWNPYYCGGIPGIANPEEDALSPDFILRIFFGTGPGRRFAIFLFVIVGMEGMYRLARRYDCSAIGATFAAVFFCLHWRFLGFLPVGWVHFFGFELMPWVILCYELGIESRKWRLVGGAFLGWIILCAGTYPAPFAVAAVSCVCAAEIGRRFVSKSFAERRDWWKPARSLIELGLVAFVLSCVKLVPIVLLLREHPRVWLPPEANPPLALLGQVLAPPAIVLALAASAALVADRAALRFFAIATLFFAIAMGDFGPFSPYVLLRKFPLYGQLRDPDRYMLVAAMFLCLAAARAITLVEDLLPRIVRGLRDLVGPRDADIAPFWRFAFGLVGAFVVYKGLHDYVKETIEKETVKPGQVYVEEGPPSRWGPFKQARGNRWDAEVWSPLNMGSMQCHSELGFDQSPLLRGDLPAEEYPADPAIASVQREAWSPNHLELHVVASAPTRIYVNQNWNKHWRTNVGEVKSEQKLLAVDVPAGDHHVVLRYRDWTLLTLLVVSGAGWLALFVLGAREAFTRAKKLRDRWRVVPWFAPLP